MIRNLDTSKISDILNHLNEISEDGNLYSENYQNTDEKYQLPNTFKLSWKYDCRVVDSWGSGLNRDEAAFKAFTELLERIYFYWGTEGLYKSQGLFSKEYSLTELTEKYEGAKNFISPSTSGMAIHTNKSKAKENALTELIERHTVLKALVKKVNPQKLEQPNFLSEYKLPTGLNISLYRWLGPFNTSVVLCEVQKGNHRVYGLGSSPNLEEATKKAFLEVTGNIIYLIHFKEIKEELTPKDKKYNFKYHLLGIGQEFSRLLGASTSSTNPIDPQINKKDIYYTQITPPEFLQSKADLYCFRAICPLMQGLFTGDWQMDKLNPLAIHISPSELPHFPHMIG
ncbi:MAG: YcaO-like family protein [Bdellovibrionales bacterium]|nr:YcaO-like family protein [Bdellovibrionales bacterium]